MSALRVVVFVALVGIVLGQLGDPNPQGVNATRGTKDPISLIGSLVKTVSLTDPVHFTTSLHLCIIKRYRWSQEPYQRDGGSFAKQSHSQTLFVTS
ncbi:hypothetical protein BaRGS_00032285 [Batillaria attramentaria]|uniref:Uncharacterized protein n=1 Tax=Batillaria attramentaria TaxID=370345 RepID=A0ABD0JN64_9CAEN